MLRNAPGVQDADVTVVTVNYRTPDLTMECLASLRGERKALPKLKVVIVDGCSEDGSAEKLASAIDVAEYHDWVTFLPLSINGGFGWANNQAVLSLAGQGKAPEFVHFLNPDAQASPGAVTALVREFRAHFGCGAAGSQLIDGDGKPVASAFRFPSIGRELISGAQSEALGRVLGIKSSVVQSTEAVEADWVTGASVMFRFDALHDCGLFDDGFFLYFDEVELLHRLRSDGWTVRHVPASRVVHLEGSSTGIAEGAARRSLPAYWYNSRRRYFTLANGAASAFWASVALFAGRSLGQLKSIIRRAPPRGPLARDLVRHGILPTRQDRCHSAPRIGDAPGMPPFWMTRQ
jgi:N-acetylglucosaminyl-diphospho-decaprenol L-rhamnosyltransferase